ncbi:MAG: CotH kinase family protein [Firmicutes bacterium]|nr:CotH kinase family protein [Bacillota bacterium]
MKKTRWIGAAALAGMLVVCAGAGMLYSGWHQQEIRSAYSQPLAAAPWEEDPTAGIDVENGYTVSSDFTTHLPLVILDLDEGEPPISMRIGDNGVFCPIEGVDPYVGGTFSLIDNGTGVNKASDAPALSSLMNIKRRGNSSSQYPKAQWMVKFVTESGQDNDLDVLGMGAEHEWILNGSLMDKSMMRNYLAYSIASEFMPNTPDYYFCEVLLRENGVLRYQGVFLLGENIKQGENRVDIQDYKMSSSVNSYLIRRDRYDEDGIMLETYGRLNGYSTEYIGLIYPTKARVTENMISYVEQDISAIERILYSEDASVFATYPEVIDVDSFVDYFLLNEFLICYDAGNNSTYMYKDYAGKLCIGPVWDYDGATDNYWKEPVSVSDIAFQTKPWFDRLCQDKSFVQKIIDRYTELRRNVFSDAHITEKINEIISHLGGAEEREWLRWGEYYTAYYERHRLGLTDYVLEDGTVLHRNAETFEEELYRIRTALFDHGDQIPQALEDLREAASLDTTAVSLRHWMLLLAALVFLIPSLWVALRR